MYALITYPDRIREDGTVVAVFADAAAVARAARVTPRGIAIEHDGELLVLGHDVHVGPNALPGPDLRIIRVGVQLGVKVGDRASVGPIGPNRYAEIATDVGRIILPTWTQWGPSGGSCEIGI